MKGVVCSSVLSLPASSGSPLLLSGTDCRLCAGGCTGGCAAAALGSGGGGRAGKVLGHLDWGLRGQAQHGRGVAHAHLWQGINSKAEGGMVGWHTAAGQAAQVAARAAAAAASCGHNTHTAAPQEHQVSPGGWAGRAAGRWPAACQTAAPCLRNEKRMGGGVHVTCTCCCPGRRSSTLHLCTPEPDFSTTDPTLG